MELADHVADGARGLLVLGAGGEPELAHRVDDAPLHRLQAVAERRQRAIEDHVHRVVEIGALGEGLERLALDALEIQLLVFHGARSRARLAPDCPCSRAIRAGRRRASSRAACRAAGPGCPCASMVICTRRRVCGAIVVSRSCIGLISPRPLKRVTTGLARGFSRGDALQRLFALRLVERVDHLLAGIDAEQRRHAHVHVAGEHQRPVVPQEQRAQQRRDVLAVAVGVGQDADLVVAQAATGRPRPDRRRSRR